MNEAPPSPAFLARLDALDRRFSTWCLVAPGDGRRRTLMGIVRRLSQTGSYGVGWIVLFAVVVTAVEGWKVAALAAACVVGTLATNTVVKEIVRRPRPVRTSFEDHPSSFSMPSAHTSMAVVGAAIMSAIAPALWPLWWAWTLLLATSRIVLGMHYVGDVVMGAVFGALLARFVAVPLIHLVS